MKNLGCTIGLITLCLMKAALLWSLWCGVVGLQALIGVVQRFWVWRNRTRG